MTRKGEGHQQFLVIETFLQMSGIDQYQKKYEYHVMSKHYIMVEKYNDKVMNIIKLLSTGELLWDTKLFSLENE